MIGTWILLIVLNTGHGISSQTVEYLDADSCSSAKKDVTEMMQVQDKTITVSTWCILRPVID